MDYKQLEKNAIKSWIISRLIVSIIITLLTLVARYFAIKNISNFSLLINILTLVIIAYFLAYTFIFPFIQYKEWNYLITEDKIELKDGIIILKTVVIPIVKIQHITLSNGPIDRFFNLYKISIQTASSEHSIPCISQDEANKIKEFLNEKITIKMKRRISEDEAQ